MSILNVEHLTHGFGDRAIFSDVSFRLLKGEHIGLVGANGEGKSTFMSIVTGKLMPDEGKVEWAKNVHAGYLDQHAVLEKGMTIQEVLKSAFDPLLQKEQRMNEICDLLGSADEEEMNVLMEELGTIQDELTLHDFYVIDSKVEEVARALGLLDLGLDRDVTDLSGGQRTKVLLGKLLLEKPDILLLDEPTNHLDFETMEWLESYLKTYPGAILVVSHDRYFLDAVCNRIFEIEDNTLTAYKGNYSAYLPQKEAAVALQQKQHDADMEKAAKLEDYIARNLVRASTTKMAQSRRKQLEKMEITEAPRTSHTDLKFRFTFDVTPYNEILTAKNISVTLGGKRLVEGLDLLVKRGERLVIAGPNGAGKSTLLRVLDGKLRPQAGTVRLGAGAKPSVFEQQQLRRGGTVISTIWDKYPKFTELEVRSHLAKLNFRGEDVFKPCSALSGGELARLRFAEILLEKPNLLFLDEPTNHLDIYTRESLGAALASYEGTLVLVTHDRYLMNSLACPILFIENGKTSLYEDYDAMMHRGAVPPEKNIAPEKTASAGKAAYGKEQRRRRAELRARIKALEDEMETLALRIMVLEGEVNDPDVLRDHTRLRDVCDELDDTRFHQDEVLAEWERLVEEQEAYEQENDE